MSDISFIRWLEQNNMGDYISSLRDLGITEISHLLSLSHAQLIELAHQLGCSAMRQVLFAECVISNEVYLKKSTINLNLSDDEGVLMSYKLLILLKRLSSMGARDNWDSVTEDIYELIDMTKNLRSLIASIEEVIKIDADNYIAWDLNGLINARRGFLADARVAFQRSLVKNPNYLNARFNHARLLHYELGEYERAKSEYESIMRVKPNFSRAYNSYAKLQEKLGNLEMAEKYFRAAIQLRPKSISYRHCLANILSSQRRHFEVQQIYQESVEQHPKSATLRFHHALALVKCKYLNESEMEFKNAIKLNSSNAQIYHEYAKFCERHREPRDYKKATDLYFKACSTDPINYLSAAVDAANLMRRLDTAQSLHSSYKLFDKLVMEAPHLAGVHLGFAKLLVRQRRYADASKILNNGCIHHPNDHALSKYYTELKKNIIKRPSIIYQSHNEAQDQTSQFDKLYSLSMSEDIHTPPLPHRPRTSSIKRYTKRGQEEEQSQNPIEQHRKSIKKKVMINEEDIFDADTKNTPDMKDKKQQKAAPRTSQQFNPQTLKKRQSLQLHKTPLISETAVAANNKRSSVSQMKNNNAQAINIINNHALNGSNPKETCLLM
eukprot:134424_1